MKNILFILLGLTLALAAFPAIAEDDRFISLSVENDNFGGNSDRYYTSGVRLTYFDVDTEVPRAASEVTEFIPTFDVDESTSTFFTLGHNIYTPKDIRVQGQPDDDRPWAAFLYGSIGMSNVTHNDEWADHIDDLEITIGVIGPEALGEQTQKFVHKYVSNSPQPQGWRNQLDFEPGINLTWNRRMPYALSHDGDWYHARVEPNFSLALGNVHTYAGLGATVVISSHPQLDTPPRVRPSIPGNGVFSNHSKGFDWQLFAGVDGRVVGRDIFLDGNTFSDSHSVDKNYFVGDFSAGASLIYDDYRLSYTLNMRSREFKSQDEDSIFGSVTLTKRF